MVYRQRVFQRRKIASLPHIAESWSNESFFLHVLVLW